MTTLDVPVPPANPAPPACNLCGVTVSPTVWVGHWQRRLTPDEITEQQVLEQARRDEAVLLADPQLPEPEFPPMPGYLDATRIVFGCKDHAITQDAAALTHQAHCTAPAADDLPGCNCTPEPAPQPEPGPTAAELPPGWN